jgi:hypothetical protein
LQSERIVPQRHYLTSATAACPDTRTIHFEITHPFHPKRGTRLVLLTRRQNWGEDRVMFFDAQGHLHSMLASWTSVADADPFADASSGRSWFRPDDLMQLGVLISEVEQREAP